MNKKGMTLIELMVAVTIFIVVITLAVGGFISISRARILVGNMKDSQQKIRVANEMIVRYAKQAESISIVDGGKGLEMYFDLSSASPSAKKIALSSSAPYDQLYYECPTNQLVASVCGDWGNSTSLLGKPQGQAGGMVIADPNVFSLSGVLPSVLELNLVLQNNVPGFSSLDNSMTIRNSIILEGLK